MDFLANLIAALAAPVFILLVGVAFWISLRANFRAFGLTMLLAPVALLGLGADQLLDSGRLQSTTVIVKEEQITPVAGQFSPDGAYRFVLQLRLADGAVSPVETDSHHFDALREGDETGALLFALGPLHWIWTADLDRALWLRERLHTPFAALARAAMGLAALLVAAGLASLILRRPSRSLVFGGLGVAALAAGLSYAAWADALRPLDKRASAIVIDARRVSDAFLGHWVDSGLSRTPLVAPYNEVRLSFTPEGARDAVTAIDRIDEDAAPPVQGAQVDIAYAGDAPRRAEMTGRTRAFANADRLADLFRQATDLASIVALLCLVVTGLYGLARRRARASYAAAVGARRGAKTNF